jgi:thiol-disulfide isomerase/thioredoxin
MASTQQKATVSTKSLVYDYKKLATQAKKTPDAYWRALMSSAKPSIVRVVGHDCSACVSTAPMYRDTAKRLGGKVNFIDMHYEDNRGLTEELNIKTLPSFVLVHRGNVKVLDKHGSMNREILLNQIQTHFKIKD